MAILSGGKRGIKEASKMNHYSNHQFTPAPDTVH
jgi:hypothetical protein